MLKLSLSIVTGLFLAGATASAQTNILLPTASGGGLSNRATGLVPGAFVRQITAAQLQEAIFQNYTNGNWVDFSRARYSRYYAPLLPGLIETDLKNGNAWTLSSASRLRYNSAGLVLTDTIDQFQQPTYGPFSVLVNTYNTPTQVRWEWQLTRPAGSAASVPFDSVSRNTHTYNAAGQRTQVLHQLYTARTFLSVSRDLYTYNAQNLVSVQETQTSTNNGTNWAPSTRSTYTYNAANKVQQVVNQIASSTGVYTNSTRDTYQYDAQGRPSVVTTDNWVNNAWVVDSQNLYAYNAAGDLASLTNQDWTGSAFVNVSRVLFNYQQVTSSRGAAALRPLAVVPNPSEAGTTAQILLETGTAAPHGAVFDQLGRRVTVLTSTPAQAARGVLPLPTNLPAGLYLVYLRAGNRHWQARWQQL
ncbi:hypothetical protein I2I05_01790 [Hymenobacter sp. BT683]|uniref:T9SS type A sorting domain-containing protein n=1 Tax=Hymenobacter jeongseonensis TaxID=2791027 RepID=A0ABS0ICP0_9BACT|nr:hypothetical protein [Hymenobacter jeongseonensis]MBF9236116.1 hypothetical protein [Hymenobacter jeongseonensis]